MDKKIKHIEEIERAMDTAKRAIQRPDMSPKCEQFIKDYVTAKDVRKVLELGSGGSTKMFELLGCKIITIEHNPSYYTAIRELCPSNYVFCVLAMDINSYLLMLDFIGDVDLVFIDGKHRVEAMQIILDSEKEWKTVMVHDSEREEYQESFDAFEIEGHNLIQSGVNLFVCRRKV